MAQREKMLDIAVIGAGPVGLASAAAVLQKLGANTKLQVFDRVQELAVCGAGLAMNPNGLSAIEAISPDLYKHVCNSCSAVDTLVVHKPDGSIQSTPASETDYKKRPLYTNRANLYIGWADVRDAFIDWLPANTLQLNKCFSSLTQHEDHVVVSFADGTSIAAKVVVGADGSFSKVRQHTMDDGPPDFAGMVFWRARLPLQQGLGLPTAETHTFIGHDMAAVFYPIANGQCVWTVGAPESKLAEAGIAARHPNRSSSKDADSDGAASAEQLEQQRAEAGKEIIERCKKVWGDRPGMILASIDATDPATALEHNLNLRHPDSLKGGQWGVGRVTLVGDAAHPLRPTGQGVNQGFEDACELAHFLDQGGLHSDSLRRFEASRIPRVQEVMAAEMINGMKAYSKEAQTVHKAESLADYKWAQGLWKAENSDTYNAYQEWVLFRSFPLAA